MITFDRDAPLERQRTRDGDKLSLMVDSKLSTQYAIAYWDVYGNAHLVMSDGRSSLGRDSQFDIVTLPELLPLIVSYHSVYEDGCRGTYLTLNAACESINYQSILAIIETIFDPNTSKSSVNTVWTKEESA